MVVPILALGALVAPGAAAKPPLGAPVQLTGQAGCLNSIGGSCAVGEGLGGVFNLAVSPDGKNLYSVSQGMPDASDAIAAFSRNATSGALTQLTDPDDCIAETGNGGACVTGKALGTPMEAVVSPDGENVYVVSYDSYAVAVFDRDSSTGALTQLDGLAGCVSDGGKDLAVGSAPYPTVCTSGSNLFQAERIAISPDGEHVYVTARGESNGSVVAFDRDATSGALTQIAGNSGCLSTSTQGGACRVAAGLANPQGIAVSGDGKNVYVVGTQDRAVAVLDRNASTGVLSANATTPCFSSYGDPCATVPGLTLVKDIVVSPAGGSAWASASGAVVKFLRNGTTGALTPDGCFAAMVGGEDSCTAAVRGMRHADALAFPPNGENLYIASGNYSSLAYLHQPSTVFGWGCVNAFGGDGCRSGRAMTDPRGVVVSPDSKFVYLASFGTNAFGSSSIGVFKRELTENHLPTCEDQTVQIPFETPADISFKCADQDGDNPVQVTLKDGQHGSISAGGAPFTLRYTPEPGYLGPDQLVGQVYDDVYGTAFTVSVQVGGPPSGPDPDPDPDPAPRPRPGPLVLLSPGKYQETGRLRGSRRTRIRFALIVKNDGARVALKEVRNLPVTCLGLGKVEIRSSYSGGTRLNASGAWRHTLRVGTRSKRRVTRFAGRLEAGSRASGTLSFSGMVADGYGGWLRCRSELLRWTARL